MKKAIAFFLLVLLAGCGRDASTRPVEGAYGIQSSELKRVALAQMDEDDKTAFSAANRRFAFELFGQLHHETGNLLFSPYAISLSFAMLQAGAGGETKAQIGQSFGFLEDETAHHGAFNYLSGALEAAGIRSLNALWLQRGFRVEQGFLDTLALHYGAHAKTVDFAQNPAAAAEAINGWVSAGSEGYVDRIFEADDLTGAQLALTNTLVFSGHWKHLFSGYDTALEPFTLLGGESVTVPTMSQSRNLPYHKEADLAAVRLYYGEGEQSMLLVVPDLGRFAAVEAAINAEKLAQIEANLSTFYVSLSLPKFSYESSFDLPSALKTLGVEDAFLPTKADFSRIHATQELFISAVKHKTRIETDEEGTTTAAATAIATGPTSPPPAESALLRIDRPFLYLILDQSGTVLFMGRVVNPLG